MIFSYISYNLLVWPGVNSHENSPKFRWLKLDSVGNPDQPWKSMDIFQCLQWWSLWETIPSKHNLRCTLPETNSQFTPENRCLEDDPFLLGRPIFRCELLVSVSVFSTLECVDMLIIYDNFITLNIASSDYIRWYLRYLVSLANKLDRWINERIGLWTSGLFSPKLRRSQCQCPIIAVGLL